MVSKPEVVVDGIAMPEGPVWCDDGTLVCTSVTDAKLWRIWPEQGRKEELCDTEGGANSAALASDGGFVITQNGGIDFHALQVAGDWAKPRYVSPGLQRMLPDRTVVRLVHGMQAPNDLVVAPDGTVYFTDPWPMLQPREEPSSRVMAYEPDGSLRVVADGFVFCNGIVIDGDGHLVVTEANGLMRVFSDGTKEWIIENLSDQHAADGLAVDMNGVLYLAGSLDHGIRVVDGDREVDFWPIPGDGATTNCCFGGPDGTWMFATDGLPGQVVVWHDLPTPGKALTPWPAAPA
jgi:gluconolactonase